MKILSNLSKINLLKNIFFFILALKVLNLLRENVLLVINFSD